MLRQMIDARDNAIVFTRMRFALCFPRRLSFTRALGGLPDAHYPKKPSQSKRPGRRYAPGLHCICFYAEGWANGSLGETRVPEPYPHGYHTPPARRLNAIGLRSTAPPPA
ncbi:MAG: hypothetical protein IH607_05520 [Firmicutes bacterium]|nr:hypothetical protein [Bacillota bacterium]